MAALLTRDRYLASPDVAAKYPSAVDANGYFIGHPETELSQIVDIVRQPSTAYIRGALVNGAGLEPGLVLRCTTAGTTSSAALDCTGYGLGDTITDGTATWLVVSYAVSTGDAFFIGLDGNWCPSSADIIYSAYFSEGADGNLYPLEGGN